MEEKDKVWYFWLLPEDFNSVITAIETLSITVTIKFVQSRLIAKKK